LLAVFKIWEAQMDKNGAKVKYQMGNDKPEIKEKTQMARKLKSRM
jgi:hypothetical protein